MRGFWCPLCQHIAVLYFLVIWVSKYRSMIDKSKYQREIIWLGNQLPLCSMFPTEKGYRLVDVCFKESQSHTCCLSEANIKRRHPCQALFIFCLDNLTEKPNERNNCLTKEHSLPNFSLCFVKQMFLQILSSSD